MYEMFAKFHFSHNMIKDKEYVSNTIFEKCTLVYTGIYIEPIASMIIKIKAVHCSSHTKQKSISCAMPMHGLSMYSLLG